MPTKMYYLLAGEIQAIARSLFFQEVNCVMEKDQFNLEDIILCVAPIKYQTIYLIMKSNNKKHFDSNFSISFFRFFFLMHISEKRYKNQRTVRALGTYGICNVHIPTYYTMA